MRQICFRTLGPVSMEVEGRLLKPTRRRDRAVLAVLLFECGRVVALERMVRLLWSDADRPQNARRAIQIHVARLRSLLAGTRVAAIRSSGAGYVFETNPEFVDIHQFRALTREAKSTADPAARSVLLRKAIDLWQGPALGDSAVGNLADTFGRELDELYLTAVEDWYGAELSQGRHREHSAELSRLAAEHLDRETMVGMAMLALHRRERTAEALALYARCRSFLVDEYGLEPSNRIAHLHQAILRRETDVLVAAMPSAATSPWPT